ncbi:MAG: SPOR domain-containing protein, partial [Microcystaceae cyanobacterium]
LSDNVKEFTFTAEDTNNQPVSPPNPPANTRPLPPLLSPKTSAPPRNSPETTFPAEDTNAQVPSFEPPANNPPITPSTLPPPPQQATPAVVPPPPLNSTSSSGRKNLSDVLVVAPRSLPNGNSPNAPTPDSNWGNLLNQVPPAPMPETAQGKRYRVMVAINNTSQQDRLRSLYPDAFPTVYNGQSLWQVGVFSSQENAQEALQGLNNSGLRGLIVQ